MDDILVKVEGYIVLESAFKGKETVSINDLIDKIEELEYELEHAEEELRCLKEDMEENYRPIPIEEQVGVSEKDFI